MAFETHDTDQCCNESREIKNEIFSNNGSGDDSEDDFFQESNDNDSDFENFIDNESQNDDYILLNQDVNYSLNNENYYRHIYLVDWVETNEPLFDPNEFQSSQSHILNHQSSIDHSINFCEQDRNINESVQKISETKIKLEVDESQTKKTTDSVNQKKMSTEFEKDKIDTIKQLMSNFKLPEENIPDWARKVPEDEWKNFMKEKTSK